MSCRARSALFTLAAGACLLAFAAGARAQATPMQEQVFATSAVFNPASKLTPALVLPAGTIEVGGDMALLTSDRELGGAALDLTDLGLLRLRGRKAWNGWLEASVSTQLLVKQPRAADEPFWQGAAAGARAALSECFALQLAGSGGPLLDVEGFWIAAEPRLLAKRAVDSDVRFELGLGYALTALEFAAETQPSFALHEAVLHAEAQLGSHHGGFWVRLDYRLPFAHAGGGAFDPTPQLDLQIGGVLSAGSRDDWDLFAYGAIVDRGELGDDATSLPILVGGFDQQQWVIGVQHRFGP
jgi:hypothetical protein